MRRRGRNRGGRRRRARRRRRRSGGLSVLVAEAEGGVVRGDLFAAGKGEKKVRVWVEGTRSWAERVRECLDAARRAEMDMVVIGIG